MRRVLPVIAAVLFAGLVLLIQQRAPHVEPQLQAPATDSPAQPYLGITPMPVDPFEFQPDAALNEAPALGEGAQSNKEVSSTCAQYIQPITRMSQQVFGLNAPVARFAAQLEQESKCQPTAISSAGARGIAQMMPATAKLLAKRYPELQPVDPHDPNWSIRAQLYLMRDLLDQYEGARSECDQWQLAWSAYNGGQRALGDEQRLAPDAMQWADSVQPQRSHRRSKSNWIENRDYVRQIPRREQRLIDAGISGTAVCA